MRLTVLHRREACFQKAWARGRYVRNPIVRTPRGERVVWEFPIFDPLNDRSGEIRCAAKCVPLHMRLNAAPAIASTAQVRFVRRLLVRLR